MTGPRGTGAREIDVRFVRAIAEQLPAERVAEVYLFPPLRQGTIESGVAVVAVTDGTVESGAGLDGTPVAGEGLALSAAHDPPADIDPGGARTDRGMRVVTPGERHVVYTATYRHTRKGPERGTWSVEVVAQADAPLEAVAAAVRGVHRRAGDGDGAEADRLSGTQFRALLADSPRGDGVERVGVPTVAGTVAATAGAGATGVRAVSGYAADAAAADCVGVVGRGDGADSSASSAGGGDATA